MGLNRSRPPTDAARRGNDSYSLRVRPPAVVYGSAHGSIIMGADYEAYHVQRAHEWNAASAASVRRNFSKVEVMDRRPWPAEDRDGFYALGQCADASRRRAILNHAMGSRVLAVAIECGGAAPNHGRLARRYGYNPYTVWVNSVTFGTPVWRVRPWAVFLRADHVHSERLRLSHVPRKQAPSDLLACRPDERDTVDGSGSLPEHGPWIVGGQTCSPAERRRLMGLPDTYGLRGPAVRQVVPPPIAAWWFVNFDFNCHWPGVFGHTGDHRRTMVSAEIGGAIYLTPTPEMWARSNSYPGIRVKSLRAPPSAL